MIKIYMVTVPLLLLSVLNSSSQNHSQIYQTQQNQEVNTTKPLTPKPVEIKKVSIQDFPHLQKLRNKYKEMSKRERKMRLNLEEAKMNYSIAIRNFDYVLDVKALIEDIHSREECYIAYYRIKELEQKLKTSSELDTVIYHKIKDPLDKYLSKCGKLKLDTLKKYKNIEGK